MHRRLFVTAFGVMALPIPAIAETLNYRGFSVDTTEAHGDTAISESVKHQIDIVADCGAKPEIIGFFKTQKITLRRRMKKPPGNYTKENGIDIIAKRLEPQKPIILHELLHAWHDSSFLAASRILMS